MKWLSIIIFCVLMGNCAQLPREPAPEVFSSTASLSDGLVEHYVYKSTHFVESFKRKSKQNKNLLLVIADSFIQNQLRKQS